MALVLSLPVQLSAESMGVSHGHDLDELWAKAQKQYDLKAHDAVLLLEGRYVSILENGNLRTRVHRVVWIGTEVGIEDHADLRIPWNSATSTFTVVALRTWNDGRWWPDESEVSEIAVVETLPFALAQADDYTSMRETMLLHDGVELPCIMETIYEIEDEGAAKDGADDLWVFYQSDPAVLVEYELTVPAGVTPVFRAGNGAPEPETATGADQKTTYTWRKENTGRLGTPRIAHPAVYAPSIMWSTWKDWEMLSRKIASSFDEAAVLSDALADSLSKRIRYEPSDDAKVRAIVDLMSEWTRSVDYNWDFWRFSPRTATRTWETGYGHALDRAALAAALFRETGFRAQPVFRTAPSVELDEEIPGLSQFENFVVLVEYDGGRRILDPADGTWESEYLGLYGRTIWNSSVKSNAFIRLSSDRVGGFEMILTLTPADGGGWSGYGFLDAHGKYSTYDNMSGLGNVALDDLNSIVQSVLPETKVGGFNPVTFNPERVTLGFDFEVGALEPDGSDRISLIVGDPKGGIIGTLPGDVHVFEVFRNTPILLDGRMIQRIELRLKTGDRRIVYLPEPHELENKIGRFALTVERENGWITIGRELNIEHPVMPFIDWILLRALLLEEQDLAHRFILLK